MGRTLLGYVVDQGKAPPSARPRCPWALGSRAIHGLWPSLFTWNITGALTSYDSTSSGLYSPTLRSSNAFQEQVEADAILPPTPDPLFKGAQTHAPLYPAGLRCLLNFKLSLSTCCVLIVHL